MKNIFHFSLNLLCIGFTTLVPISSQACERHCYDIVTDSNGTEVAIWEDIQDNQNVISASTFQEEKSWSSSFILSNNQTQNPHSPHIVADTFGNVVAAWLANDPQLNKNVLMISCRAQDGVWGQPQRISTVEECVGSEFTLGINNSGQLVLSWTSLVTENSSFVVRVATGTVASGFQIPRTVSI